VKVGKVRAIGASNLTPARLSESLVAAERTGYPAISACSPLQPVRAGGIRKGARRALPVEKPRRDPLLPSRGRVPYGKYRSVNDLSKSARGAGLRKYLNERGFRILAALDTVGRAQRLAGGCRARMAAARPGITAPIVSATSIRQWEDIMRART